MRGTYNDDADVQDARPMTTSEPTPHLHGTQCCPACWYGDPTHVSENEHFICRCEPLPRMTQADLNAYADYGRGQASRHQSPHPN